MSDILTSYSSNGLPTSDAGDDADDDDTSTSRSQFILEQSWTDVVRDHESLDKRQRDYQEAVWELLTTELDHISKLRVIIDVRSAFNALALALLLLCAAVLTGRMHYESCPSVSLYVRLSRIPVN